MSSVVKLFDRLLSLTFFLLIVFLAFYYAQAAQYYASKRDVQNYHIEQWKRLNPEEAQVANIFIQQCFSSKRNAQKTNEEVEWPPEKPEPLIALAECADKTGAGKVFHYMNSETEKTLRTVLWPLSLVINNRNSDLEKD